MAPTAVRFVEHAIVFGHNASEWSKHEQKNNRQDGRTLSHDSKNRYIPFHSSS
jgi:hypothetical protein